MYELKNTYPKQLNKTTVQQYRIMQNLVYLDNGIDHLILTIINLLNDKHNLDKL